MKLQLRHHTSAVAFLILGNALFAAPDEPSTPFRLDVESGTASFESATNMPGIDVKGKSSSLSAHVDVASSTKGLMLRSIEAIVPVKTLATGMKVRDEHMRKYIFTTADGQTPDIRFEANSAECQAPTGSHDFNCKVPGTMTIRGTSHAVELNLQAKQQSGSAYRVTGDSVIKLSDFAITPPSQFGVTPANEVKIRLEFSAKTKLPITSSSTGGR